MRGLFLALALACLAPLGFGVASCASFQALTPHSAREALAESEIAFVGVIQVATEGVATGVISHEDALKLDAQFVQVGGYLDTARSLLAAGDEAGANRSLVLAHAIIRALSVELAARAHAANAPASTPPQPEPLNMGDSA